VNFPGDQFARGKVTVSLVTALGLPVKTAAVSSGALM
jgi:hypothetical protein